MAEVELENFDPDTISLEDDDDIDTNEEDDLMAKPIEEESSESSNFDWVESSKYWYALLHIVLVVFGIGTIILLGLSAPGLWKFFNHDTVCEEASGPHFTPPSNRFTFSDMMSITPNYPSIHWIASASGNNVFLQVLFHFNDLA